MLSTRNRLTQTASWKRAAAPLGRPGARGVHRPAAVRRPAAGLSTHPLTDAQENERLYAYERGVKQAFDAIVPTLKRVSAIQHEADFETRARHIAWQQLGFELPDELLADAWVGQLDMRRLFAWSVFETYRRFCDDVFSRDPLGTHDDGEFQNLLQQYGFHALDISPCADGRLAHVIRYVLRLPYRSVRRRSYAGALFDIENSLEKWVETELLRFREGRPNTADAPTRYLKAVVYHFSSVDPEHEGCAAHGSDTRKAAQAGLDRLLAFQQAVQNTHCCGASVDHLLIGMDTDTDTIRLHVPDAGGDIDLERYIDSRDVYGRTQAMTVHEAEGWISDRVNTVGNGCTTGMVRFISHLLINNISQIDYVRVNHGVHYGDVGHAERFIGAGIGFEEIQLRNLTYFAYLKTVEEAAADMDVGIRIFTRLNVSHGLPVPVVVRYDYHGNVPGARERAGERCRRVATAISSRYPDLARRGLLHTLQVVRDINAAGGIEVLGCSVNVNGSREAHR